MHKTTYLIHGIRFIRDDLKRWGFDDWYDERLLPYIEGRPGVELDIIMGENSDSMYAGFVLAKSEYDTGGALVVVNPDEKLNRIRPAIIEAGIPCTFSEIHLYFVDLWN